MTIAIPGTNRTGHPVPVASREDQPGPWRLRLAILGEPVEQRWRQLQTGLRPDTIRVYDLDRHFRDEMPHAATMPELFRKNGWFSARVGKLIISRVSTGVPSHLEGES